MTKRILVVDDDASVRDSLKRVLEETGYEVVVAANGAEGQEKLRNSPFDLAVLDVNMPEQDGWDVLEVTTVELPLLPVILITGLYDQLDSTTIPGIAALMEKPVDAAVLLEKVNELISESPEARLLRFQSGLQTKA